MDSYKCYGHQQQWLYRRVRNQWGGPDRCVSPEPALPGDANLDGKVDINDLTIVLAHYGQTGMAWTQGEFTGDGTVDINDLTIVLAHYGQSLGSSAGPVAAVPEPAVAAVACRRLGRPIDLPLRRSEVRASIIAGAILLSAMRVSLRWETECRRGEGSTVASTARRLSVRQSNPVDEAALTGVSSQCLVHVRSCIRMAGPTGGGQPVFSSGHRSGSAPESNQGTLCRLLSSASRLTVGFTLVELWW